MTKICKLGNGEMTLHKSHIGVINDLHWWVESQHPNQNLRLKKKKKKNLGDMKGKKLVTK